MGLVSLRSALILSGAIISNACFVASACALYK